jgi:capsular polysaccharide export protein
MTGAVSRQSFLRIPPFPGAKLRRFTSTGATRADPFDLADELRQLKVGGSYWGLQPLLPRDYVLVRSPAAVGAARELAEGCEILLWTEQKVSFEGRANLAVVSGECDPWHMLSSAKALVSDLDDEVRLVAALLGLSRYLCCDGIGRLEPDVADVGQLLAEAIGDREFENPFTGEPMSSRQAVQLCGFWRALIDSNRSIAGGHGFAFWKQASVAPLLWSGSAPFNFIRDAGDVVADAPIAVWRAKAAPQVIAELERRKTPIIEVEDGFLRSRGLGADCIPPLSITVDRRGAHFDPSQPSELEVLLEHGEFDAVLLQRARDLRRLIVEAGIGKYEQGGAALDRRLADRPHILVPGQVEDDRAVQAGGCGLVSNLDLLRKVREQATDAYVLYKPHPDVLAGHRRGAVSNRACLEYADEIVGDLPIASLIAMADEVHVNTSLAGFEALLRGKKVVTYGVPFYAGWGLTHDLGPVPRRRTARRSVDELVAATLLIYPRYLDPVTGLPCPAEIVVARLSSSEQRDPNLLVGIRRLQGKLMRRLRSLVQ